jgi:hypothetical protein
MIPFRLTPRAIVRQRFRFYRRAYPFAWALLVLSVCIVFWRGANPLILWLAGIMNAAVASRWEHWRTERLCLHSLLVGYHRRSSLKSQISNLKRP